MLISLCARHSSIWLEANTGLKFACSQLIGGWAKALTC